MNCNCALRKRETRAELRADELYCVCDKSGAALTSNVLYVSAWPGSNYNNVMINDSAHERPFCRLRVSKGRRLG